jgi:hypothetical protein
MAVGHSVATRRVVAVAPLVLVALLLALSLHSPLSVRMDTCYIQRELERPAPTTIPLSDSTLHFYSVFTVWAAMLVLLLLPLRRVRALYTLAYTSVWFHCTYVLLAALKAPLDDFKCAGRHHTYPNGISGHYCYFVFVALTVPLLVRDRLIANPSPSSRSPNIIAVAASFLAFFAVGAPATLYRTFIHGYHSFRQILLGAALGMESHAVLERFILGRSDDDAFSLALQIAVLAAKALSAFTLYFVLWPVTSAGPALTPAHFRFHIAAWCLVISAAIAMMPQFSPHAPSQAPRAHAFCKPE